MGINIKSEEVVALARDIAAKTGRGLTQTIHDALKAEALRVQKAREAEVQRKLKAIRKIQEEVRKRPDYDPTPIPKEVYDDLYE
jgi:antitoxin VapB